MEEQVLFVLFYLCGLSAAELVIQPFECVAAHGGALEQFLRRQLIAGSD